MIVPRALLALVAVSGLVLATSPAGAFCRKTTASADDAADPSVIGSCPAAESALPLYWRRACIPYRVIVDAALEQRGVMTTERAERIVAKATSAWTSAQCTTGRTSLALSADRCPDQVGAVRSEIAFTAEAPADDLLARTDLVFDANDGVVTAAHTRVLDIYATLGATNPDDVDTRVEAIVRHEMGHFLGLAHSDDPHAVMFAGYDPARVDGLTPDDVAAMCEVYDPARPIGAGCSAGGRAVGAGAAWAALGIALLLARRRRRVLVTTLMCILHATSAGAEPARAKPAAKRRALVTKAVPSKEDAVLLRNDEPVLVADRSSPTLLALSAPPPAPVAEPTAPTPVPAPVVERATEPVADGPARALHLGGRYRAFYLPQPVVGLLAQTNRDLLFHSVSIEADLRGERTAIAPALSFVDLGADSLLVGDRGSALTSSFSAVKSDMKAVAASVTFSWLLPMSRTLTLEVGGELGFAFAFGALHSSWVHETPDGPLAYAGRRFAPCRTVGDGFGCRPQDHASPTPVKVGDYEEKSVFAGGMAPTLLPLVSVPAVGVRAKVGDASAVRFALGASLTGAWASLGLEYGVTRAR